MFIDSLDQHCHIVLALLTNELFREKIKVDVPLYKVHYNPRPADHTVKR
jgi:hypothetical protein